MMNYIQAVERACEEKTLLDALSWICVWESERAIEEAHKFKTGQKPRNTDGTGWSTCFKFLIKETMEQYTVKKLKGE